MTSITTRAGKGSPLTHNEVDANFTNLNNDKLDTAGIALGSAASPTLKFTGDTNTGIYSPGANQVAVSTGGSERLRITSAGLVGIGTSSPSANLTIQGISGTYPTTEIRHSTLEAEGEVIRITRTDAVNIRYHSITAQQSATAGGADNYLAFKIHNVASTTAQTEVLRLTGNGRVGIGITSPDSLLHLADAGNITVGTTTGTKIGTTTTQKLGFYNAAPVVQPTAVADATDAATVITQLNALLAKLRTLGIIAT